MVKNVRKEKTEAIPHFWMEVNQSSFDVLRLQWIMYLGFS